MKKKFTLVTTSREPQPRSKRLRKLGGTVIGGSGGSTIVNISSDQGAAGNNVNTHTHENKSYLDQITTDTDGYGYLTQMREVTEEDPETGQEHSTYARVTDKIKAGYADRAGIAHDLDPDSPVRDQFLSKLADDVAKGHITFEKGLTALLTAYFKNGAHFGEYVQGFAGAAIDAAGNAEVESLTARGYLKVFELIYNRLNALEGNTSFGDVGTIEDVVDGESGSQVVTMRKRWEGDFTAFQPGDVIYGYVYNLDNATAVEYYKAWAWVKSVDRANNALHVVPYADAMTPAGVNHALTPGMIITRWGNNIEANAITSVNPDYSAVIKKRGENDYVNVRQSTFYISCEDGNLVELMGVNKPILEARNYGTILGKIPAGLLDPKTAELINDDQPYLFARGIVVQDLIRVDYEGAITRTSNYRGQWSADTAASENDYYRSTAGAYDTVTHNGCLWQCIATGTTDEPSEETGDWLNMAGGQELPELNVWNIIPSTDIITLRYDKDQNITIEPSAVTCEVLLTSTEGTQTYKSSYNLASRGVCLYYSLDGLTWRVFVMGAAEPLDLEDGTGVIEAETSTAENPEALIVGGDDVTATEIGDRLFFELREGDTVLARTVVPIVKDGEKGDNGLPGRDGLMVYPAGYFDATHTYSATSETAPVVMYENNFYVLKYGKTYTAADMPENRRTPAADVAAGGAEACWRVFDKFNAIFADIIMAEFAKLGSAVFYGDWLISQQGKIGSSESEDYVKFKTGEFIPNYAVNFKTGEIRANKAVIKGTIDAEEGHIGGFEIGRNHLGVDTDRETTGTGGMSLFPDFIKFTNNSWSHEAFIGNNCLPASSGRVAVGRFANTDENTWGTNYGLIVDVQNASNNIAIHAKGNIVTNGLCGSWGMKTMTLQENVVTHEQFSEPVYLIKCNVSNSHVAFPDRSEIQSQLGIAKSAAFSVRITIIADASNSKAFKVQGRNTSIKNSSDVAFLDKDIYPYRLDNNGQRQLTDGLQMGAGDICEYQLVYDGNTYNAYLLNFRS